MCKTCESDKRDMWGPSQAELDLEVIQGGNWINLVKCIECGTLWVVSHYEPYSSFPYWVKWNYHPEAWNSIHEVNGGKLIHDWHKLEIKKLWTDLPATEKEFIEAHRKRSYGHHNPIDMPVDNEEEVDKLITAHNKR